MVTVTTASDGAAAAAVEFPQEPAYWRGLLRDYAAADARLALAALIGSVGGYLLLSVGMYLALGTSVWLTLAIAPLTAAFLLRTFIIFHDCGHGSFFASRRANQWVGRVCATIVLTPFSAWRHEHNIHHATSGDLDKRGIGDVPTLTLAEYRALPRIGKVGYRLFRNPLVMFGIGPIVAMMLVPRWMSLTDAPRFRNSTLITNAVIAAIAAVLIWAIGLGPLLLVWAPPALIAGSAGVWLFYVQHQFEDVYWQRSDSWSYADAALRGSSFLDLPKPLAWATGNIGFHHVHHLSSRVPFYKLPRTHHENEVFGSVPVLTLRDGLRCTRFKLYDEQAGRMIGWAEAKRAA